MAYMVPVNITCIRGNCRGTMRPLKNNKAPVANVLCSDGLEGLGYLKAHIRIKIEEAKWSSNEAKKDNNSNGHIAWNHTKMAYEDILRKLEAL